MNLENEILAFFKKEIGIKNIDLKSNIGSEKIGLFDLDAEHVMHEFFKKYNIDYSGFVSEKYFQYPNYSWKSLFIIRLFFEQEKYPSKPPITIGHMIEVAKRKEWFDPV